MKWLLGKITNLSDHITNLVHQLFPWKAAEQENKFLIDPKQMLKKKLGRNSRSDRDLCEKGNKSLKKK